MSTSWRHGKEDYIQAVKENQPAGTTDIAETLGVARPSAEYRLKRLEKEGEVSGQKIGGSLIWSLPD